MGETQATVITKEMVEQAGLHLTFSLGSETYGIEILKVQEIIGVIPVTRVPKMPDFVRGVVNLRGKVIPVIDLRAKFGLRPQDDTQRTCIIVVQMASGSQRITMGVLVDEVAEVVDISDEQIDQTPTFGAAGATEFIRAIGKVGEKVVMLLDMDQILSGGELGTLR